MSEVKVYTFDEICESQDFNHHQEFVLKTDYDALKAERDELKQNLLRFEGMTFSENQEIVALKAERDKLKKNLEHEEMACLSLIEERDHFESRIDDIALTLGDEREWTSHNDRSDNCIEGIESLQHQITTLTAKLEKAKEAFSELLTRYRQQDYGEVYEKEFEKTLKEIEKYEMRIPKM